MGTNLIMIGNPVSGAKRLPFNPTPAESVPRAQSNARNAQCTLIDKVLLFAQRDSASSGVEVMISESEAGEALRDIERVHRRTAQAGGYSAASPHLLLSGLIWAAGYVASGLTPPEQWAMFWIPLSLVGVAGSYVLAYRAHRPEPGNPAARTVHAARGLWITAAMMVFVAATFLLFRPVELTPYLVFPALLLGLAYSIVGAFGLPRFLWIGAGVFAVTIAGLVLARESIAFWIAAAGGGGLMLGGLWLRKA
jgi:hypothetical protein